MDRIHINECSIRFHEEEYNVVIYTGSERNLNEHDDNVDIEIVMNNGKRYSGTVFTLKNIQTLMEGYKQTGECCNGLYFGGCKDIVLVEKLTIENISEIIRSVYQKDQLETVFNQLYD